MRRQRFAITGAGLALAVLIAIPMALKLSDRSQVDCEAPPVTPTRWAQADHEQKQVLLERVEHCNGGIVGKTPSEVEALLGPPDEPYANADSEHWSMGYWVRYPPGQSMSLQVGRFLFEDGQVTALRVDEIASVPASPSP